MRKIIGVLVGMVAAILLVDTAWAAANALFPAALPDNASDAQVLSAFVMAMPWIGQLVIAIGWFVAGFVSAYAALRVAQWRPAGWIAVLVVIASGIWNITQLAQPLWLQIAAIVMPLLGAWLAERHFRRARAGDPLIN